MTCSTTRELLSGYVDGELTPEEMAEVSDHLTSCDACADAYAEMVQTVQTLREGMVRYQAPDVLRARVRTAIRSGGTESAPVVTKRRRFPWRVAAAVLVTAIAATSLTMLLTRGSASARPIAEEVLASHIRSLMPDHLTDIASTDQHNVKPWFNGRLDFSPAVPRFDDQGFPLLGGRLDYVHGRPVAAVVYGRRQHKINVYSWPVDAAERSSIDDESHHGYNLLHWRDRGMEYWVASDLNATELRQFVELLRGAV